MSVLRPVPYIWGFSEIGNVPFIVILVDQLEPILAGPFGALLWGVCVAATCLVTLLKRYQLGVVLGTTTLVLLVGRVHFSCTSLGGDELVATPSFISENGNSFSAEV